MQADPKEKLESFGYNSWFQDHTDAEKLVSHEIARVVSVHRNSYMVTKGNGDVFAELIGKLAYTADSAVDLPTTGDWVYADFHSNDTHAIIHDVLPRKTVIKRKKSGKSIDFQLVAANIDVAFIVQSADFNFNLRRLERYLVMINENNITPVILLSKSDLKSAEELEQIVDSFLEITPDTEVLAFSSQSGMNVDAIKGLLLPGQTYCLLGSSGVGKTTLLNTLVGSALFETQSVSKKENKGRHTTTSRELIQLDCGAMLIDTPGMRELGNMAVDEGIEETFADILALSANCKFNDCAHIKEKGCAVLAAIDAGELSEDRYQNYMKMRKESTFNEMSYAEKRKKDKRFGKLVKSTMKSKGKK